MSGRSAGQSFPIPNTLRKGRRARGQECKTCRCKGSREGPSVGAPARGGTGTGVGQHWDRHGVQRGELGGEGRQPPEAVQPGHPRARCPRTGSSFPGCRGSTPRPGATEPTAKVRDAGQRGGQLSPVLPGLPQAWGPPAAGGESLRVTLRHPPSCSPGESARAEGISTGNVWISQIRSLRQRDSPRPRAGRLLVRGEPREPGLTSSPWEMNPRGFGMGSGASIHVSCSGGKGAP